MALSKQQYIDAGRRDAETFPSNINRPLYESASWQGKAYKSGCDERAEMVAEAKRELARRDAPAVQSIAPDTKQHTGFKTGPGSISLDGVTVGTVSHMYIAPANSPAALRRLDRIASIVKGYLVALAWSTCGTDPKTEEEIESLEDYEPSADAQAEALAIATAFYDANTADLGAFVDLRDADIGTDYHGARRQLLAYEYAGHDLWLTSAGHGAGFWDRGMGRLGERLTKAAKAFEGCDAYVSDAEEIEISTPYHAHWKK